MNYKSFSDLSEDIRKNLNQLNENYDLVVGIPRSGMIPAYMIALHLNVNCTTIHSFLQNEKLRHGNTRHTKYNLTYPWKATKILLVDDSIQTGRSLKSILKTVPQDLLHRITTLVIYSSDRKRKDVDIIFSYVPMPRMFEWNIYHHSQLSKFCIDIDGLICLSPSEKRKMKEIRIVPGPYTQMLQNEKIHSLVTSRTENDRPQLEAWLKRNNLKYEHLVMVREKEMKEGSGNKYINKAEHYKKSDLFLFLEEDPVQAKNISKLAAKPVFCVRNNKMYLPELIDSITKDPFFISKEIKSHINKIVRFFKPYVKEVIPGYPAERN